MTTTNDPPAVPDPTVEALATMSRGEGVEFYAKVLDAAGFPLAAVIVRDAAARAAAPDALRVRIEALAADWRCNCGGPSPEGHHEMHCDSYYGARLRALLADGA